VRYWFWKSNDTCKIHSIVYAFFKYSCPYIMGILRDVEEWQRNKWVLLEAWSETLKCFLKWLMSLNIHLFQLEWFVTFSLSLNFFVFTRGQNVTNCKIQSMIATFLQKTTKQVRVFWCWRVFRCLRSSKASLLQMLLTFICFWMRFLYWSKIWLFDWSFFISCSKYSSYHLLYMLLYIIHVQDLDILEPKFDLTFWI